jgi:hypothetical protein
MSTSLKDLIFSPKPLSPCCYTKYFNYILLLKTPTKDPFNIFEEKRNEHLLMKLNIIVSMDKIKL